MAAERKNPSDAESLRLLEDARRVRNWKRWGPYLSERQWATVREDYSQYGNCWSYLSHDDARSRAYRWGEDGLLGICDRECRVAFALGLWNERDPILKERLFGLTGEEGNHGEDVKECYFYTDSTPTHSYLKALYKYPQGEFPYSQLVEESRRRGREDREFELLDTGIFNDQRYFDVIAEYAKASPDDIAIRITVVNRGDRAAKLHVLPTLWMRNTWSWGRDGEGYWPKGRIERAANGGVIASHSTLGELSLQVEARSEFAGWLFTDNETNSQRLWGTASSTPYVKDGFNEYLVRGDKAAINPAGIGTKAAAHYQLEMAPGASITLKLRLSEQKEAPKLAFGKAFDRIFADRIEEADEFYEKRMNPALSVEERRAVRQCYAGLLWSKQFYHYIVKDWLEGDPGQPPPPAERRTGRNSEWEHLYNRDVISMPDKWEYPWYASWDLAFHMLPMCKVDPEFAKGQLLLLLREWYMHPNGQVPAYEFALGDVDPPVHAWACWRVYKSTGPRGARDTFFLERAFQKLLLNFTWWVNRKDIGGKNIFGGGFLGLDNIGVFDRSRPLPTGGVLEQADGTAWMAFYCTTMLGIAIDLAHENPVYEDIASKFFEHFVAITDAINTLGGFGLWDEQDGFYYDQLMVDGKTIPLRIRSMVGLVPLFAVEVLEEEEIGRLPEFTKRVAWFIDNRPDLARQVSYMDAADRSRRRLLAIPSRERLERVLRYVLDENEFLSPYGIRSLSRYHLDHPFVLAANGDEHRVQYVPGESNTGLFGGNSNWRGPIWFPLNYLLIESLERYHHFYGDSLQVECPVGSGQMMNLNQVAVELARRLGSLFLPDSEGKRALHGEDSPFSNDPDWRELVLFYEYFHGENGRGLGASHQTGWTSLMISCLESVAKARVRK